MEAKQVDVLPEEDGWQFEPKWDGFRCLAFVASGEVRLVSKSGKPLERYFPDIAAALRTLPDVALDGELIIPVGSALSFDALQLRLHPSAKRVAKLAAETPARFMLFDHLNEPDAPLSERRKRLEGFYALHRSASLRLSPMTVDRTVARQWLDRAGGALDGVIAKRSDEPYRSGERAMIKVKNLRTADCVVGGYRTGQKHGEVASLLLGLYDEAGRLDHVGFTSALAELDKAALKLRLDASAGGTGFTGDAPGGPSRWNRDRATDWVPLRPELVVEVRYDHVSGGRFRHGTGFVRWRPDKEADACTRDQLQAEAGPELLIEAFAGT